MAKFKVGDRVRLREPAVVLAVMSDVGNVAIEAGGLFATISEIALELVPDKSTVDVTRVESGMKASDEWAKQGLPIPKKDAPPFAPGDVVRLKSGGPLMTVTTVGEKVTTRWFAAPDVVGDGEFFAACLERVPPPDAAAMAASLKVA